MFCGELASPLVGGQDISVLDQMSVADLFDWRELIVGTNNRLMEKPHEN